MKSFKEFTPPVKHITAKITRNKVFKSLKLSTIPPAKIMANAAVKILIGLNSFIWEIILFIFNSEQPAPWYFYYSP